jgi:dipeptidyl aminopeptidase/acylaminoacyl peptidase
MSADGRFIVFIAWTEVPSRPPGLYLYDRLSGTSELLAFPAYVARISADSRYVAFTGDPAPGSQEPPKLYLHDRISKSTVLVPPLANPGHVVQIAGEPVLSADGRYVAFARRAFAPVPVPFSTPGLSGDDIVLFDRVSGSTVLVSRAPFSPTTPMGESGNPLISADGRRIAFTSSAALKAEDFNDLSDAYLFSLSAPTGGGTTPLPPCKLLDTRRRADRPALRSDTRRTVRAAGVCGVPATAKSVSVTVTALQATGKGNLRFYPGNDTVNSSGILRFEKNATRSGTFNLPLATNGAGTLAILPFVAGKGTVQVVVEVNGYSQ